MKTQDVVIAVMGALCILHIVLYFGYGTGIFRGIIYPIIEQFKNRNR